jgi:ATP synthase protein I
MDDSEDPGSLDHLADRLRALRSREDVESGRKPRESQGASASMGLGFRIGVELVAGIAVGTFLGYGLDSWLGTRPWLMVVLFFLGAAAGVLNAYRAVQALTVSNGGEER